MIALQRTAGNALVARRLAAGGDPRRGRLVLRDPVQLGALFNEALAVRDWPRAVRALTEMPEGDRHAALQALTSDARQRLRDAAWALEPDPSNPVVAAIERLGPGTAVVPNAAAPAPPAPLDAAAVAAMTPEARLAAAYERARLAPALRDKIASMITPQALVVAIAGFAVVFVASQLTPVGWAADIGLVLTAAFVGGALFTAAQHLIRFADARNATTPEQLDQAGAEFAAAVAEISVDAVLLLVMHSTGGSGRGGTPLEGPPPVQVRVGVTPQGFVVVAAETVPASVLQPAISSAALGGRAAAAAPVMMSAMSGGGGPGGGSGSGGGRGPTPTGGRSAEETFIERLKERFPRLRSLDMRPRARPSASRYTSTTESPEVMGGTEHRTQVSGAPEHAFEERMQTSQGGYSLTVYSEGTAVIELDGVSVDGWIEEVKIEQSMSRVDDIVTQLRVQADFAEAYGLRGVRYSISPPAVAEAVESRVAEEGLFNTFRADVE